jgi:hypothetical protein
LDEARAGHDGRIDLEMQLQKASVDSQDGLSLHTLISALSTHATKSATIDEPRNRTIRFPYSRHSSYSELCELVAAFRPQDVFPCTVDEANWTPSLSMHSLFGQYCSTYKFRHDGEMTKLFEARAQEQGEKRVYEDTQEDTKTTNEQVFANSATVKRLRTSGDMNSAQEKFATPTEVVEQTGKSSNEMEKASNHDDALTTIEVQRAETHDSSPASDVPEHTKSEPLEHSALPSGSAAASAGITSCKRPLVAATLLPSFPSFSTAKKTRRSTNRQLAYEAAIGTSLTWADFGGLTSTRSQKEREEEEL